MNYTSFKLGPDKTIKWSKIDIEKAISENNINKKIDDETMLMHSVKVGDYELAKKLIKLGADTSIGDRQNRTPLWLCTIYNNAKIAELLIESGASMEEEIGSNSPLYNAIKHDNDDVSIMLIKLGANPNLKNRDNQTPLHCAVFRNNYKIVKMLLDYGADKNIKNNIKLLPGEISFDIPKSQSPYEMALDKGDKKLIALFEEKNKVEKVVRKNTEISEKDLEMFREYLLNESNIMVQKDKTSEINYDYSEMNKKISNGQYYNLGILLDDVEENEVVELFVNKYYKKQLNNFNDKYDMMMSLKYQISNNNYKLGNEKGKINSLAREKELLKQHNIPSISDIIDDNKSTLFMMYVPFVLYFLFWIFGLNDFLVLSCICVFLLLISLSTIGEVFNDYDNKSSKAIYVIVLLLHCILIIVFAIVKANYSVYIIEKGLFVLALIDLTIPLSLFVKEKKNLAKERYDEAQKEIKKIEKEKKVLTRKYNQTNKIVESENSDIEKKYEQLRKELDKIRNEKLNEDDLTIKLKELYKEICNDLIVEQQRTVTRWNDFAEFRKKHYVREVEEQIDDSGIIYDVAELTYDDERLNKTKINSKNYDSYGDVSDYINYIYDCIDSEDEEL